MENVDIELLLDVETYFVERDEFEHFNVCVEQFYPTEFLTLEEEEDYYIVTFFD